MKYDYTCTRVFPIMYSMSGRDLTKKKNISAIVHYIIYIDRNRKASWAVGYIFIQRKWSTYIVLWQSVEKKLISWNKLHKMCIGKYKHVN